MSLLYQALKCMEICLAEGSIILLCQILYLGRYTSSSREDLCYTRFCREIGLVEETIYCYTRF